jgi:hypothetical protein
LRQMASERDFEEVLVRYPEMIVSVT